MKKHPLLLFFLLIFLITTSTTCENYDYEETYVPCTLTGVEVYSWDNAGAEPQVPIEQKNQERDLSTGDPVAFECRNPTKTGHY